MSNRSERMHTVAQSYVDQELFSGIEWHVEAGGQVLDSGAAGLADHAAGTPIPDKAIYRIFSMTKPIVSLLALQFIEQGKLRLFDMVAQFDQRFAQLLVLGADGSLAPANRQITVEDLLTHRAGFTYEFLHGCHVAQYYRAANVTGDGQCSLDQMMAVLAEQPLAFQPGTAWRYSVSIDVLAHVLEKAGGDTLDNLLAEHIFKPLGMQDTAFAVPPDKQDRLMPMYGTSIVEGLPPLQASPQVLTPLDVEQLHPVNKPDTFRRGGLGLYSTISDYAAFARMLLDGKAPDGQPLVSRKMLETLRQNRIPSSQLPLAIGPNVFAGYGWGLIGRVMLDQGVGLGLTSAGEFGWAGAAATYFWVDPLEQMIGVVMTQYMGSALPLSDDMRTAAYQLLP